MNKDQIIQIAKAGFPNRVKKMIDFKNCEIFHWGNVYRLYYPEDGFMLMLPMKEIISIVLKDDFVQFSVGIKAFNHYAAIKEMLKMKLIK